MTIRIDGTNSAANPGITGTDTDTGLQFGTDEVNIVTGGSTAVTVDSSQRLLVGTSNARTNLFKAGVSALLQVEGVNSSSDGRRIVHALNSNDTGCNEFVFIKSRGTSSGSNTIVQSGDNLGGIFFNGTDGAGDVNAASIQATVDSTPGTNDMPGRLVFGTTADGASAPTERMRIQSDGQVIFSNQFAVAPNTDNITQLGGTGKRYSEVWAANGTIQTSDQRTKTQITDAALGSDFIKALRPVSYQWIEGGKRPTGAVDDDNNWIYESVPGQRTHWGFIAQEVKQAVDAAGVDFGGWILTDKNDPDSQQALRYDQFIAPLTKALQEALAKIETLETRVAALEGGNN